MPQNINQPSNRINLTNVAVVRYRRPKSKCRFELACYKNKLLEYRSGTETELDNILQIPTIFLNVSKGMSAPNAELDKGFGKGYDKEKVIREILDKGEVQVGAGERREERDRLEREVLDLVVGRLVDPNTKRVYTAGIVKKALDMLSTKGGQLSQGSAPDGGSANVPASATVGGGGGRGLGLEERMAKANLNGSNTGGGEEGDAVGNLNPGNITPSSTDDGRPDTAEGHNKSKSKAKKSDFPTWTGVVTTKSAKSQALEAMKALIAWQPIPVMRARMRLRITCSTSMIKQPAKSKATAAAVAADNDSVGDDKIRDSKQQQKDKGGTTTTTIKDRILSFVEQVESQDVTGEEWEVVGFVEPGAFKVLTKFVSGETKGRGRVEVLDMAVIHED